MIAQGEGVHAPAPLHFGLGQPPVRREEQRAEEGVARVEDEALAALGAGCRAALPDGRGDARGAAVTGRLAVPGPAARERAGRRFQAAVEIVEVEQREVPRGLVRGGRVQRGRGEQGREVATAKHGPQVAPPRRRGASTGP